MLESRQYDNKPKKKDRRRAYIESKALASETFDARLAEIDAERTKWLEKGRNFAFLTIVFGITTLFWLLMILPTGVCFGLAIFHAAIERDLEEEYNVVVSLMRHNDL